METDWTLLHLKVNDKKTKKPIPVRFHIEQEGGYPYIPPSNSLTPEGKIPPVITAEVFKKNLHLCQSACIQSSHLTYGEALFPVPAGKLTLYISRGYECLPISRTFAAKANKKVVLQFELSRIEDMSRLGWYPGDMHVHFTRQSRADDVTLAHLMAAEGLSAVNNMVYKSDGEIQAHQREIGHRDNHHRLCHHHQVISGGEEFRDDDMYGHMIATGIKKIIEPVSVGNKLGRRENYPLFSQVCDWTHDQNGIAGWAHGAATVKLHESLPIEAALRKLDFIEGIQFNSFMGFYFWYRLLNCGLKLSITGGSDFPFNTAILAPWYINFGLDRTYVYIGDTTEFTYEAYIEGIRRGRSFATNGPLLFLEVKGQGPGSQIHLDPCVDKVDICVRGICQYPLDRVEIVVNGAVRHTFDGKGDREIACETDITIPESAWVAARVRGSVEPKLYGGNAPWNLYAHTSPIYIMKGAKPIVQKADATWMADYVRLLAEIYRRKGMFKNEHQREALNRNISKALSFYEKLLK